MCSARVDPLFVIKAFAHGADGVLVAGCHLGDCHYINGNYKAKGRMEKLRYLLEEFGIEKERLKIEWISASEGDKFATTIREFTQQLEQMGDLKEKENISEIGEKFEEENVGVIDETHS